MNICEIGSSFSSTTSIEYLSTRTFLEFDALIIDLEYLIKNSMNNMESSYIKRRESLLEFLHFKNIPIIYFTPVKNTCSITQNSGYSKSVELDFFVPIPKIKTIAEMGKEMSILPNTALTEFFLKYKNCFEYNAFFSSRHGTIMLQTGISKKTLGFYNNECVFLPRINGNVRAVEKEFLEDLVKAIKNINKKDIEFSLPDWAENVKLPEENNIFDEISQIKDNIDNLSEKLISYEKTYQEILRKKLLFTSSGNILEKETEKLFKEMGFEILESERNRDDLIVKYGEKVAVIEIKGITNSAAEKHAAQLEKWSAEYFESTGLRPKPILLVNTYRELPIMERKENDFPNQMLKYSEQREHCLLTTIQLLNIYYSIKSDVSIRNQLINSIFSTVGVYKNKSLKNHIITSQELIS